MNHILYKIELKTETGLHIGAGNDALRIGGVDSEVIKNNNGEPYIPGSSLKGKIRFLLEQYAGIRKIRAENSNDGSPLKIEDCKSNNITKEQRLLCEYILKMFGIGNCKDNSTKEMYGYSRLLFRDFKLKSTANINDILEVKAENTINRQTGKVDKDGGSVRFIERVTNDIVFEGDIVLRLNDDETPNIYEKVLFFGLHLLEYDALGGSGSRGYGQIKIEKVKKEISFDNNSKEMIEDYKNPTDILKDLK